MTPTTNDVEPTTSATEILRRMLDERGVEWGNIRRDGSESDYLTEWQFEDNQGKAIAIEWAVGSGLSVEVHRYRLTPAQAIAATLGSCNCTNDCTNGERTGTCLPHFWTHDGALHIELPKLPESISVRLPNQRDREVGSTRTWQFTRDSGTCHECAGMDDVFECSACGGRYIGAALKRWARYCPDCGRKVVTNG